MGDNKSDGIGVKRCVKGVIIGVGDSHHSRVERRGLVSRSERRGERLDGKSGLEGKEGLDGEEGPARGHKGVRRQREARR